MGLMNLIARHDQLDDAAGNPLAGGRIHIYAPNTTTRITSYSDSALIAANTNPVVLDADGRASIWLSQNADVRIEDADGALVLEESSVNPDVLTGDYDSGLVPNGGFENDEDANGVPDGWTVENEASGSNNGLDTSESSEGAQSWRTESTGAGGGELVTTDFFPVNDVDDLRIQLDMLATVATVRNIIRVEWFDVSQVSISDSDVYDSTANPTAAWTTIFRTATPPAGARFARLRLIGGTTGGVGAGITYWDRVQVFYPLSIAGVFDNVTIQGNDIITTNTNGDLNLTPNGTGVVNVAGSFYVGGIIDFDSLVNAAADLQVGNDFSVTGVSTFSDQILALGAGAVDLVDADAPIVVGPAAAAHLELDPNDIQAKSDATTAAALAINRFGGDVVIGAQSGAGLVGLWASGHIALGTEADGVGVYGSADDVVGLTLRQLAGTPRAVFEFDGDDTLSVANLLAGGNMTIATLGDLQIDSNGDPILTAVGGDVSLLFGGDPAIVLDGSVQVYDGADLVLRGHGNGIAVRGAADNTPRILFEETDGTLRALFGYLVNDAITLENEVGGGGFNLVLDDGGDVYALRAYPGAAVGVELYAEGVAQLDAVDSTVYLSGGRVRWNDGSFYTVARLERSFVARVGSPLLTFTIAAGDVDEYQEIAPGGAVGGTHSVTFASDAAIPVGASGYLFPTINDIAISAGAGITVYRRSADGSVDTFTGPGLTAGVIEGEVRWYKRSATTYVVTGAVT